MLRKIKSLFIVEDDKAASKKNNKDAAKESSQKDTSGSTHNDIADIPVQYDGKNDGEVDEKMINILMTAIEKNNLEGFDYLEYKQALQSLSQMGMDEGTKYKSAFAMATTMGATKQSLLKATDHYLKVLDVEKEKFNEALKNQRSTQIQERQQQKDRLHTSIENKKKEIARLQQEIDAEQNKLTDIESQISLSEERVASTKNSFYTAFHIINDQIKEDKDKMDNYLQ